MTDTATTTRTAVLRTDDLVASYLPGVNILNGCTVDAYQGSRASVCV